MVDKRKSSTKDKWKEKSWYTIVAPSYFGEKEIGLSPSSDPKYIVNRTIAVPISDFTGNFKKSSSMVIFKIDDVIGKKCSTVFIGHEVSEDTIRRMVRRRKERIDIITNIRTKDLYKIAVKFVLVADAKLTEAKRSEVRKTIKDYITQKSSTMELGEFALYVIGDEVYNELVNSLKNVYPIRKIEVRKTEVLGKEAPEIVQNEAEEPVSN